MPEITLDHIHKAAEWAKAAAEAQPIEGLMRQYNQLEWDCGTSCCIWGAASILAGCGPATSGPSAEWAKQSLQHTIATGLMNSSTSKPEQVERALRGASLIGASLSGASLIGADLSNADLSGADLRGASLIGASLIGADLSNADLSGADLRGASLIGASLSNADLSGANLIGANLIGASLSGADLSGAYITIGNVTRQIKGA